MFSMGAFALVGDVNADNIKDTITNGANQSGGLDDVATNVYGAQKTTELEDMIVFVINAILGLLGIIFLVLTLYAGFLWMTAAGNDEQVTKAKSILTAAIIGVVIIVAAYAITNFVLEAVLQTV